MPSRLFLHKELMFLTNKDKINKIINKYKGKKFRYFDDFYREIIFVKHSTDYIIAHLKPQIHFDTVELVELRELDKLLNLNNYKLQLVGNVGGLNFGFVRNEFLKENKVWDILAQRVVYSGGKLYIDVPFYRIMSIDKKDKQYLIKKYSEFENSKIEKENYFDFKNMKIHIDYIVNRYNLEQKTDLILYDLDQIRLCAKFIKNIFIGIDKEKFIDVIGFKYFLIHDLRKDRLNFYFSYETKYSLEKLNKLVSFLKSLVNKYQQEGLKFSVNNFIMPYDFDQNRVIANTYIPDSFNKSILYFILLYISLI